LFLWDTQQEKDEQLKNIVINTKEFAHLTEILKQKAQTKMQRIDICEEENP
jgi:hypothetical protein